MYTQNTHTHTFFMYTHCLCVLKHTMVFNSHLPTSSIYIYISIMYPFSIQPFPRSTGGYIWSRPYQFTVFASVKLKLHRTRIEKASRICCLAQRRLGGSGCNGGREWQRLVPIKTAYCYTHDVPMLHMFFLPQVIPDSLGGPEPNLPCSYIGPCFFNKQNDEG